MPNAKNNLKLTGDTHLPDVGFEPLETEESLELLLLVPDEPSRSRVYADGWVPPAEQPLPPQSDRRPTHAVVRRMEAMEAKSPWLAVGAGALFGWLVARMLRR